MNRYDSNLKALTKELKKDEIYAGKDYDEVLLDSCICDYDIEFTVSPETPHFKNYGRGLQYKYKDDPLLHLNEFKNNPIVNLLRENGEHYGNDSLSHWEKSNVLLAFTNKRIIIYKINLPLFLMTIWPSARIYFQIAINEAQEINSVNQPSITSLEKDANTIIEIQGPNLNLKLKNIRYINPDELKKVIHTQINH